VKITGTLLAVPGSTVRPVSAETSNIAAPAPSFVAAVISNASFPLLVTVKKFVTAVPSGVGANAGSDMPMPAPT